MPGRDRLRGYLELQRDLYAYLHDQTLRMLNKGMVGAEIAEAIQLPPALEAAWHARGYYGSVSHNLKAIYQRYLGWYDGNPAHLWQHTPTEAAARYVAAMGGAGAVLVVAREAFEAGDFRWVVELVNHVIFADPENTAAKALQADAFEQLGFGAENGTWRSVYLAGATELRHGSFGTPTATAAADLIAALSPAQLFDAIAIRVDGPRAWDETLSIGVALADDGTSFRLDLRNGVLVHREAPVDGVDLVIRTTRAALPGLLVGQIAGMTMEGDVNVLARLVAVLEAPDPGFAIVTP